MDPEQIYVRDMEKLMTNDKIWNISTNRRRYMIWQEAKSDFLQCGYNLVYQHWVKMNLNLVSHLSL